MLVETAKKEEDIIQQSSLLKFQTSKGGEILKGILIFDPIRVGSGWLGWSGHLATLLLFF